MRERAPVKVHELAAAAEGPLSPAEGNLLFRLARFCRSGCIVEIGSFHGKATTFLGLGSQAGDSNPVYAIEPDLDPPGLFQRQMEHAGIADIVRPVLAPAGIAVRTFTEPIEFLFLGGSPDDVSVRLHWDLWVSKVMPGGYVALHNTLLHPAPRRLAETRLLGSGNFVDTGLADSIAYGRVRQWHENADSRPHTLGLLTLKRVCDVAVRVPLPSPVKRWGSQVVTALQPVPGEN